MTPVEKTKLSNKEIRQWYHDEVAKIPILNEQWTAEGVSIEERAYRAWEYRRDKRIAARNMMQDKDEVELLENRDIALYGTSTGPTFEFKLNEARLEGLKGNDVYKYIIIGSIRTNADIDKKILE